MQRMSGIWGRRIAAGAAACGILATLLVVAPGCKKKETPAERAGREAREAFEKSKDLMKEGLDKTKEGLEKGGEAAKDAAKDFSKGWNKGGKD